jgi:hypothetical protein
MIEISIQQSAVGIVTTGAVLNVQSLRPDPEFDRPFHPML